MNIKDFTFEHAKKRDIDELISLRAKLLDSSSEHYSSTSIKESESWKLSYSNWLNEKIGFNDESINIVIAKYKNDKVVGCSTGIIDTRPPYPGALNGRCGWVQSVVVLEEFRGYGICSEMMVILFEWFKKRKADTVLLQSTSEAYSVYTNLGFKKTGEETLFIKMG